MGRKEVKIRVNLGEVNDEALKEFAKYLAERIAAKVLKEHEHGNESILQKTDQEGTQAKSSRQKKSS